MGKDIPELNINWEEKTQITKAPEAPKKSEAPELNENDAMTTAILKIRASLKEAPDAEKYMKLIDILFKKERDEAAYKVIGEFLENMPDFDNYMDIIGLLLDKGKFERAGKITDELNEWKRKSKR